jgi:small subunit ribosomal protein S18
MMAENEEDIKTSADSADDSKDSDSDTDKPSVSARDSSPSGGRSYGGGSRGGRPDGRRGGGGGGGGGRRFFRRRKVDFFSVNKVDDINYKDADMLRQFIGDRGKILPRRHTGLSAQHQRLLKKAIKRARNIALLPFAGPGRPGGGGGRSGPRASSRQE